MSGMATCIETAGTLVVAKGVGGVGAVITRKYRVSFWGGENSKIRYEVSQPRKYTKSYWIVHFNRLNFMLYKLYLNKAII